MDEFKQQLEDNLKKDINEFNNEDKFVEIRELYFDNFENIKSLIDKFGHSLAIEDIANLNESTKSGIIKNRLLLKEINKAIKNGKLTKNGIIK